MGTSQKSLAKSKGLAPESFAKNGSEHGNQVALFAWAASMRPQYPELKWLFAIPNGGERNKIVAAHLKAEGVRSAVSDIFLPVSRGPWHGLFIELKRPKSERGAAGRATEDQLEFQTDMRAAGYGAIVCVGWEQARNTIIGYLDWKG